MVYLKNVLPVFLGLAFITAAIAADDAFTSKPAQDAKEKYDKAKAAAQKTAADKLAELRTAYITDLTAARKKSLTDNNLDEAQRIGVFTKKLEEAKDVTAFPAPAEAFQSQDAKQAQEKFEKAKAAVDQEQAAARAKLRESYVSDLTEARKQALTANDLNETQRIVATIKDIQAGPKVYLADMQEFEVKMGPWPLGKGVSGANGENKITVKGTQSPKGLSMHPPILGGNSSVKYRLGKNASVFKATVALDDSNDGKRTGVVFEALGDGKSLWKSKLIQTRGETEDCSIDLTGIDVLELRVNLRATHFGAHAVWVEPHVLK